MAKKEVSREDLFLTFSFAQYLSNLNKYSDDWIKEALKKFAKGRREHQSQDPLLLDCDAEIKQEEMDIEAYRFLKSRQNEI